MNLPSLVTIQNIMVEIGGLKDEGMYKSRSGDAREGAFEGDDWMRVMGGSKRRFGDIVHCRHSFRRIGYTKLTGASRSSRALPPARVTSRVPTRWLCSSEWVTHTIALTVFSGLRSIDKVYVSTASMVSGSRADVGSRIAETSEQ